MKVIICRAQSYEIIVTLSHSSSITYSPSENLICSLRLEESVFLELEQLLRPRNCGSQSVGYVPDATPLPWY